MTKKQLYETPEAEVLVVKIEQGFLTVSGPFGGKNEAGQTPEEQDEYTYGM